MFFTALGAAKLQKADGDKKDLRLNKVKEIFFLDDASQPYYAFDQTEGPLQGMNKRCEELKTNTAKVATTEALMKPFF